MKKYEIFRRKYPQFVYKNFGWEIIGKDLRVFFDFRIPPKISFSPEIIIKNIPVFRIKSLGQGIVDNFVFNLGLIESLSYWKTTCSSEILVECGYLDSEQKKFWQKLLIKGMGQYFYENKINFRAKNFLKIVPLVSDPNDTFFTIVKNVSYLKERFLVPMSGGKDSIVTFELLKKAGKDVGCFCLNPNSATKQVLKVGECQNPIIIERRIDPLLLEMNKPSRQNFSGKNSNRRGFLNGHTPFSALLAFLSVFVGVLFDYKYIAFSNERSANEGNVRYLGSVINHQYSKSFEFEQDFRKYCRRYLAKNIEYFSLLRPLFELQIVKIFSQYPKYFKVFSGCNRYQAGKTRGRKWCGQCPKCLFVFICLQAFLGIGETKKIFGKDLSADKNLLGLKQQLLGERGFKPFECVGTARETKAALANGKQLIDILNSWGEKHNLVQGLIKLLKSALKYGHT